MCQSDSTHADSISECEMIQRIELSGAVESLAFTKVDCTSTYTYWFTLQYGLVIVAVLASRPGCRVIRK